MAVKHPIQQFLKQWPTTSKVLASTKGCSRKIHGGGADRKRIFFFVVGGVINFSFLGAGGQEYFSFLGGRCEVGGIIIFRWVSSMKNFVLHL